MHRCGSMPFYERGFAETTSYGFATLQSIVTPNLESFSLGGRKQHPALVEAPKRSAHSKLDPAGRGV